jgi:hypothetical protein
LEVLQDQKAVDFIDKLDGKYDEMKATLCGNATVGQAYSLTLQVEALTRANTWDTGTGVVIKIGNVVNIR